MNLTVLLIAAYIPLLPVLFLILRTGSFGRGSKGIFLKLFFLGAAAAVPAFLMEAGGLIAVSVLMRFFKEDAFGGKMAIAAAILRYAAAGALIEEVWKFFVLRTSTWKQMMMDTVVDGIAASAVVGTGFSAALYGAWQAADYVVPADMETLHGAMPVFLHAGAVVAFVYALLFILSHFGFSGFMGALYGAAKRSEQKKHGKRAGLMLFFAFLLPLIVHGTCAVLAGYGIAEGKAVWTILGLTAQSILAVIMIGALISASDDAREASMVAAAAAAAAADAAAAASDTPVDFADSEDFAEFAEASGTEDQTESTGAEVHPEGLPHADQTQDTWAEGQVSTGFETGSYGNTWEAEDPAPGLPDASADSPADFADTSADASDSFAENADSSAGFTDSFSGSSDFTDNSAGSADSPDGFADSYPNPGFDLSFGTPSDDGTGIADDSRGNAGEDS